ncbi:CDGSH iron-sulfur domain-containing protein [Actinomadura gamaensis]|uniref:CDGSH iron-sulfur domain-containing protein n=1 Tax=Actinomadura gamaensis TaxID=1763541 RepID=A0ABV9TZ92_9ACTN
MDHAPGTAGGPPVTADHRRVIIDPGGPILVQGPVEVQMPDGTTATSDRFMVALCACRRSRTLPFCDTSHRRRRRPPKEAPSST